MGSAEGGLRPECRGLDEGIVVLQVVADYTDEVEISEMIGGPELAKQELEGRKRRQRAWEGRHEGTIAKDWRPAKRPRTPSYNLSGTSIIRRVLSAVVGAG